MVKRLGPKPAPHLRDLPIDSRGYPVPSEAPWSGNEPLLSHTDPQLTFVLTAHRACAVCGFPMPETEPVWRIHDEYSRRVTFQDMKGDVSTMNAVPGHLVCMLYSALVCPFWRTPQSRYSKESDSNPGGVRGGEVSIMGFRDYAIVMTEEASPSGFPFHAWLYKTLVQEVVFTDPMVELSDRYEQERIAVGGRYTTSRRYHYAPVFGGEARFAKEAKAAADRFRTLGPARRTEYTGRPAWLRPSGWM